MEGGEGKGGEAEREGGNGSEVGTGPPIG